MGIREVLRLIALHQYLALFGIVAIEEAGLPLPAPTDLVIAFYGFRAREHLGALLTVVLICALASTAGTLVPYWLSWRYGGPVARKLAGWLDVDSRRIDEWTARVARRGFTYVLVGRLVPGLRVAMSLVAGTAHVPIYRFSPAVFVAASLYWTLWVGIGVVFGPAVRSIIGPAYIDYVLIALPAAVVAFFAYRVLRARRRWSARA